MTKELLLIPSLAPDEHERWSRALAFAKDAHAHVKRKYVDEPYWWHVARVALTVSRVEGRPFEAVEAAFLHDVLEDTEIPESHLRATFGEETTDMVVWLTNPPHSFGNRAKRKLATIMRLAHAPPIVKTVKLADMYDNMPSIFKHETTEFAKMYADENDRLLAALIGGDRDLWWKVNMVLHDFKGTKA